MALGGSRPVMGDVGFSCAFFCMCSWLASDLPRLPFKNLRSYHNILLSRFSDPIRRKAMIKK